MPTPVAAQAGTKLAPITAGANRIQREHGPPAGYQHRPVHVAVMFQEYVTGGAAMHIHEERQGPLSLRRPYEPAVNLLTASLSIRHIEAFVIHKQGHTL